MRTSSYHVGVNARLAVSLSLAAALSGCASSPSDSATAPDTPRAQSQGADVVARVGSSVVTMEQLTRPLIDEYGLNLALGLLQRNLALELLRNAGMELTDEDVAAQRQETLSKMFAEAAPEDYEAYLDQLLQKQGANEAQFDLIVRTNAALKKLSEPLVQEKLTPELIDQAYRVQYGEKARVKHVQFSSLQDVAEAQRRLAAGEPFEDVARAMSTNAVTAGKGGDVPPFPRNSKALPTAFVEAAFALKPGEVSGPVSADKYHLIKLEELITPELVKFEDVKDAVRQALHDEMLNAAIGQYRRQNDERIRKGVRFLDATLAEQYQAMVSPPAPDAKTVRDAVERSDQSTQPAATQPATIP